METRENIIRSAMEIGEELRESRGGSDTRQRIIEAAERVMRARGFARTTTKEIAREAGCSEGNLYNHFDSKEGLFFAVICERFPGFVPLILTLHERVGTESVQSILEEVARTAIAFFDEVLPMSAAIMATRELREDLRRHNMGPHRANEGLTAYLRQEQRLGRISASADPEAAAALLLGACHQRATYALFLGKENLASSDERFVKDLVRTLTQGLSPGDKQD
ncbi:MAG: TetR/AcrR family transcriptional regulator [Chloroflexi bacterium]|nr:TetR/AcrR family transcriptional regulator [Chloroflexota bacterium]